jgi:hypothetical protein
MRQWEELAATTGSLHVPTDLLSVHKPTLIHTPPSYARTHTYTHTTLFYHLHLAHSEPKHYKPGNTNVMPLQNNADTKHK